MAHTNDTLPVLTGASEKQVAVATADRNLFLHYIENARSLVAIADYPEGSRLATDLEAELGRYESHLRTATTAREILDGPALDGSFNDEHIVAARADSRAARTRLAHLAGSPDNRRAFRRVSLNNPARKFPGCPWHGKTAADCTC